MEPAGTLEMFYRSSDYKIHYLNLISDGDSEAHAMILEEQPYGTEPDVQVKKRLGSALSRGTVDQSCQTGKQLVVLDD
jgi:hypothetical protein